MELLTLPGVAGVVVALGALDLDAQEDARDLAGQLDRVGLLGQRKTVAPFSSVRPVAVMICVAIAFQGVFLLNSAASQATNSG